MAKLLIVEDDDSVRALAQRALEHSGHDVEVAACGLSGLDRIRAVSGAYDLVISDVRMPGMSGVDMAKAVNAAFPALPIMLITGYADQREDVEAMGSTIRDILLKPFSLADIRERVERVLAGVARPAAA